MTTNSSATIQTFLTNLAIQGCNIITGILTARLLQPEGRGELASIILWPTIIAGLGILGTNWAITREAGSRREDVDNLGKVAVVLGLFQAAVFMAIGYALIPYLLPADKTYLTGLTRLFLLFLPMNFITLNLIAIDQGGLHWGRFNLVRLSVFLPYLLCLLIFWMFHVNKVSWFAIALLIGCLVAFVLRVAMQGRSIWRGRMSWSGSLSLLKDGFPFFLASLSLLVATQADKALVVGLLPAEAVGWYAAAFTFASAHSSLGLALGVTSFAAMANEHDPTRQGLYLAGVFRQATLLYIIAGLSVALFCPVFIVPLFGKSFAPAILPAVILTPATTLTALGNIINEGLRGAGKTFPGIAGQILGVVMLVITAWFWVPSSGLKGIAYATVVGSMAYLIVLFFSMLIIFPLKASQMWGCRPQEVRVLFHHLLSYIPSRWWVLKGSRNY